jgi:hypothetical protein
MKLEEIEKQISNADTPVWVRGHLREIAFWMKVFNFKDSSELTPKITAIRMNENFNQGG